MGIRFPVVISALLLIAALSFVVFPKGIGEIEDDGPSGLNRFPNSNTNNNRSKTNRRNRRISVRHRLSDSNDIVQLREIANEIELLEEKKKYYFNHYKDEHPEKLLVFERWLDDPKIEKKEKARRLESLKRANFVSTFANIVELTEEYEDTIFTKEISDDLLGGALEEYSNLNSLVSELGIDAPTFERPQNLEQLKKQITEWGDNFDLIYQKITEEMPVEMQEDIPYRAASQILGHSLGRLIKKKKHSNIGGK